MALLWKDIDFKQKMVIIEKAIESGTQVQRTKEASYKPQRVAISIHRGIAQLVERRSPKPKR